MTRIGNNMVVIISNSLNLYSLIDIVKIATV